MEVILQITWSEIEAEIVGFRQGLVATFKKYEGMETDAVDSYKRPVLVTVSSFAEHMGIAETTFRRWVSKEMGTTMVSNSSPIKDRVAEAEAKATAAAEVKAAKALAEALAKQKRESSLAEDKRRREEAAKIRAEEQAKAAEATRKQREEAAKEIAALKAKMAEAAKAAEFDLSTLNEAQKSQVMTMLANDPEKAKEFFAAQNKERTRKLAEEVQRGKAAEKRRREQADERDAVSAAKRASKDYDESALKFFIDSVMEKIDELSEMLTTNPVNFNHILRSGETAQVLVTMTESMENVAVDMREAIYGANAEAQLQDIAE